MSRPSNSLRVLKLLYQTGAPLSHRALRRELDLSTETYQRIRAKLINQGFVVPTGNEGRTLSLTKLGRQEFEKHHAGKARAKQESDLYEPLVNCLKGIFETDLVLNVGSLRRQGQWENPDVIRLSVHRSQLGFGPLLRVVSYEVKRWSDAGWSPSSVFEAAAHGRFCHQTNLVLEWAEDISFSHEYLDFYGQHLVEGCRRFGVGLLILHPIDGNEWRLERALLAADARPDEFAVHRHVEHILSRRRFREQRASIEQRAAMLSQVATLDQEEEDEDD